MIKRIIAKNFKAFKDLDIELRPLTILCGTNGSGKSSVMQLLLLLKQNPVAGSKKKSLTSLISGSLSLGQQKDILFQGSKDRICNLELFSESEKYAVKAELSQKMAGFDHAIDDYIEFKTVYSRNKPLVKWLKNNVRYLSADRMAPQTHHHYSEHEINDCNMGKHGQNAVAVLAKKNNESSVQVPRELCHSEKEDDSFLYQVNAWMTEVSANVTLETKINGDLVDLRVRFQQLKSGEGCRPENVGFGISYVLPVIVMILSAKKGDCLLIENPEAHLHPRGQAEIGRLIAKAAQYGIQILIETHSDHVINGIRIALKELPAPDLGAEDVSPSGDVYSADAIIHYFHREYERRESEVDILVESQNDIESAEDLVLCSKVESIRIGRNGGLEHYPEGFLDQWSMSMERLWT